MRRDRTPQQAAEARRLQDLGVPLEFYEDQSKFVLIRECGESFAVELSCGATGFIIDVSITSGLPNLGISRSDLTVPLRDAAVVIIPTIMEKTARLAVMEQLDRGKPVIVSDIGGLAEVAGDAGMKFRPGNAAALAACLRRLIDEPHLLRELGTRANNRAAAVFSLDRMIEKLAAAAKQ